MKNTELVKVEGILKYREELNKVKELTQESYTYREAARFFECASSQVSGYCHNYKELFEGHVSLITESNRKIAKLDHDAMFLLAILLSKKSTTAKTVFDNVLRLVLKEEQVTFNEVASTKETEKTEEIEVEDLKEEVSTDNVINFEDLKKVKKNKKENLDDEIECIKIEITPDGSKISKVNMKDIENKVKEGKSALDKMDHIPEEIKDALRMALDKAFDRVKKSDILLENIDKSLEECRCPECLDQEFEEAAFQAGMDTLDLQSTLDLQLIYTKRYSEICDILGIDKLDASIMIQGNLISEKSIDSEILNYLIDEKKNALRKQAGVLELSIELLAEEKFENLKEAYTAFAQEMKFFVGNDLTVFLECEDYKAIIASVIAAKEYENAMKVINTFLAQ